MFKSITDKARRASRQARATVKLRDFRIEQREAMAERSQNQSIDALERDVERLEGESNTSFDSVTATVENLAEAIEDQSDQLDAYEESEREEKQTAMKISSGITAKMSRTFANVVGGEAYRKVLNRAAADGIITGPETTSMIAGLAKFAVQSFEEVNDQIGIIHGAVKNATNRLNGLEAVSGGIARNARALSGVVTQLTKSGLMPTGDWYKDLNNGALYVFGRRVDMASIVLNTVLTKNMTIHKQTSRDDEDYADWLMSDVGPAKLLETARSTAAGGEALTALEGEVFGFKLNQSTGFMEVAEIDSSGKWPQGAIVFGQTELSLAPNLEGVGKTAVTAAAQGYFENPAKHALGLFDGKLGSIVGLRDGLDFIKASND